MKAFGEALSREVETRRILLGWPRPPLLTTPMLPITHAQPTAPRPSDAVRLEKDRTIGCYGGALKTLEYQRTFQASPWLITRAKQGDLRPRMRRN